MRSNTAFIGAVVALVVVLAIEAWLFAAFLPGYTPLALFLDMGSVMMMVTMVILLLAVMGLIGGLTGDAGLARIASGLAVIFGLLGAAYGELTTQMGIQYAGGTVSFAVTAPARAQSLAHFGLGLSVAVVSLALLRMRRRPAKT